jgi:hypothetical protein
VNIADSDVLHLSQACLHQPKAGKNYLQVQVGGTTYSIACLEKDKREHECFDLFFDSAETMFVSKGDSEIHLIGYIEPAGDGDDEDEEEEEEGQAEQVMPKGSPKAAAKSSPKAEPKSSPKVSPKAAPAPSPKAVAAKASPKASPKAAPAEDDDDDMSMLEGEESEDEEPQVQQVVPVKGKKAQAKAAPVQSPKRKVEAQPEQPTAKKAKTDETKAPAADATKDYVQKVVKYLKENGATSVGLIGSKLPRPSGVPKLKQVFEQNKDKFTIAGDKVSAK